MTRPTETSRTHSQVTSNPVRGLPGLPAETWSQIFIDCAPTGRAEYGRDLANRAPFNLCYVCRNWRQIALNTPKVWATITFDADSFLPSQLSDVYLARQTSPFESWLQRWIERSGSCLLTVELRMGPTLQSNPRFIKMQQAIKTLLPHSNRWVSLTCFLHGRHLDEIIRKVMAGMPSLEYLHLTDSDQEFLRDESYYRMSISVCPGLGYIGLDGFSLKFTFPGPLAHSLRTFHNTASISPEEFWTYLGHLPLLTDASICISQAGMHDITPVTDSNSPVEHVRLQKLKLRWENDSRFLRSNKFTFPSLTHLKIEAPGDSFALENILPLLIRSGSRIIDLSLNWLSISQSSLVNGLKLLPYIETLELSDINALTDEILISLTPQRWSDELCICPNLSSILLENIFLTPQSVKDFLRWRCHIPTFNDSDIATDVDYQSLVRSDGWLDENKNGVGKLKQFIMRNCSNNASEILELSEDPLITECAKIGLSGRLSHGLKTYVILPPAPTFQTPLPSLPSEVVTERRRIFRCPPSHGVTSPFHVCWIGLGSVVFSFWLSILLIFPWT